jgi:glyoxylase-like metal-dependent hydrolase (beta-lactamase superfamily II)
VQPITENQPLVFSGHTVVATPSPGHTPGHTVYELPDSNVLITGDALVTGHPTSRLTGIQSLRDMFHTDPELAAVSLNQLRARTGRILLPGHGPLLG